MDAQTLSTVQALVNQAVSQQQNSLVARDFGPLFDQYKITYGTALEFIADTLYDTQTYAAAGQTQLNYFQTAATNATINTTNMPLAGMLPDRQGFLVMSIRCYPQLRCASRAKAAAGGPQGSAANDMQTITNGSITFNFLNKNYGSFPLWLMPGGGGPFDVMAAEGATADPGGFVDFARNGTPDARNIYVLEQPLFLPPMTKLGVAAIWNTAGAILENTNVTILFDGLMVRPVQ